MDKNKIKTIFLDHASSAPLDAGVFKVMKKYMTANYANPSSLHKAGMAAKAAIEKSRISVARILGAQKEEIIFTGGCTESNNLALLGVIGSQASRTIRSLASETPHIITTNIEHPSVLEVCRHLEKSGKTQITYVPVEANGIVDPEMIKEAIRPNTVLISVMYANNEIGTIQPIMEIAKIIRHYRKTNNTRFPLLHTDAAQAMNYLPVKVDKLGIDLMSFNGSKIYGPKGIGVLYKKRNINLAPIMFGGSQEFGLKPGTENMAGIAGLAHALEIADRMREKELKRLTVLRDYFISCLRHSHILKNVGILINGDIINRLPNNVNISVPGIESDLLVIELDAHGIAVSAKSACKSDDPEESYVIKALRPDSKMEEGSVRFSLGRSTSKGDIDRSIKALGHILNKLKKWS